MSFGNRIKEAREAKGFTQKELAALVGVTASAITNYENETSHPKEAIIYKLFDALNVDANFLFQDEMKGSLTSFPVSPRGQKIGRAYDKAIPPIKKVVDAALEPYMDDNGNSAQPRNDTETAAELSPDIIDFESHISDLPLYTQSIAAGLGNYLDSDDYEMVGFSNVPHRANIAVRISGDSMEPLYHDGDIVFVETDSVLDAGEIGIFNYDNQGYIKKLMFNPPRLVSLNKKYPDICITEHSPCYTIGRVLGKDN